MFLNGSFIYFYDHTKQIQLHGGLWSQQLRMYTEDIQMKFIMNKYSSQKNLVTNTKLKQLTAHLFYYAYGPNHLPTLQPLKQRPLGQACSGKENFILSNSI